TDNYLVFFPLLKDWEFSIADVTFSFLISSDFRSKTGISIYPVVKSISLSTIVMYLIEIITILTHG
ncbi:MAG: hypothetical protein WAT91_01000, partial [Saprospiraceae bacterium]